MSLFKLVEDGSYYVPTTAGYMVIVIAMIAVLLLVSFLTKADQRAKIGTKRLVFAAMAIALGTVLSLIEFIHMPMGGSVTLFSMLAVSMVGWWYGLPMGLVTAVAYGFLQLLIDPYIISLPQMFVDYIFAFGALGLSGLFCHAKKHSLLKGYIAAVLGRYFFAFLSGVIFFGSSAADYNMSIPIYSLVYNGAYLGLEALITIILISIPPVGRALRRIKTMATTA